MKYVFAIVLVSIGINSLSQNEISYDYRCNDKWLDELIKTDSISKPNRQMDYMCYVSIFDSMTINKKYKKSQFLRAVAILKNECDGAFASSLFYGAFEYVFENPKTFMKGLKRADNFVLENWAYMLWNEYGMRSSEEGNYGKNLILELEPLLTDKNQLEWIVIKTELLELDKKY